MSDALRSLLRVTEVGGVTVVTFVEIKILSEEEVQEMGVELFALVERDQRRKLVLDFHQVEALPSAALGKLYKLKKKLGNVQGSLRLCSIRPELHEVFRITRLETVFDIYPDAASAIASLE